MLGNSKSETAEPYVFPKAGWDGMDAAVTASGKLIPSKMIGSIVSVSSRWRWTAETHLFSFITLGPIILKDHLAKLYFDHFLDLSELVKKIITAHRYRRRSTSHRGRPETMGNRIQQVRLISLYFYWLRLI